MPNFASKDRTIMNNKLNIKIKLLDMNYQFKLENNLKYLNIYNKRF